MPSKRLVLSAVVGIAAALVSCIRPVAADEPGVTKDEITIGMFMPLSGPLVAFGYDPTYAAKMWYDDINKKGGIYGRKIKLLIEDDKCDTNETLSLIKKFVSIDHVFLLNGGSCTAGVQAAREYVTREKVPLIALNAGADAGVFPPARYFFAGSVGTQTSVGGGVMEFIAKGLKAKKVAILVQDDDIGSANLRGAKAVAKNAGIDIVTTERMSAKATDFTATMLNIRAAKPDAIAAILYPAPSVLATQKYGEFGMTTPMVGGVQSVPNFTAYEKNVGNDAALANYYYPTPLLPDDQLKKWKDMYEAAYPGRKAGPWMEFGLPSAMAITNALQKAGPDLTREKFVDAMESLNFETGVLVGPTAYAKDRHDGSRSLSFLRFSGPNVTRVPGIYTWDGSISD